MTIKLLVLGAAAAALASCAYTPEQIAAAEAEHDREIASALGERTPGEPQDCINSSFVDGPQIIEPDTLIYRENASRLWRTTIEACPALREDVIIIAELHGSRICRNDRFRVLERGATIPSAYCRYGRFTPYEKAES